MIMRIHHSKISRGKPNNKFTGYIFPGYPTLGLTWTYDLYPILDPDIQQRSDTEFDRIPYIWAHIRLHIPDMWPREYPVLDIR